MVPAGPLAYNKSMDRDRLGAWLGDGARTWRWRFDDDYDRYQACECSDAGLRFFAHSHVPGEDGIYREERQALASFEAEGPRWRMPEKVEAEVRAWVRGWQARRGPVSGTP